MKNQVFVDTSVWISLVAAKDPHHDKVVAAWREMLDRGLLPLTTSDVISETITFLKHKAGHQTAVAFRQTIAQSVTDGRLTLVWVDEDLFGRAWEIFLKYADQDLSMTDCTSIALCRRGGIGMVLTLDRHFRMAGMAVIPEKV